MDFNISIIDLLRFCRSLNKNNSQSCIELFLFINYMFWDYKNLWNILEKMNDMNKFNSNEVGYLKYYRYEATKNHLTAFKRNNKIIYNAFVCIISCAFTNYYLSDAVEVFEYENNCYEFIINPLIKIDIRFTKEINGALYNYGNIRGEIVKMAKGFITTYQNDIFNKEMQEYVIEHYK